MSDEQMTYLQALRAAFPNAEIIVYDGEELPPLIGRKTAGNDDSIEIDWIRAQIVDPEEQT